MSHKKLTIDIKGMHCRSCEILLEDSIGEVRGVKKVRTNYKKGIAEIEYTSEPSLEDLEHAVNAAGYHMGKDDTKHFFSRDFIEYAELMAVVMVLLTVYLIARRLGFLDFNLNVGATPGLVGVLIVGLTAGVSSCMALIGGLVLGMSSRHAEIHLEATPMQKFKPHLWFNLGRLVSYVVLGGFIGLLGSVLKLSSSVLGMITVILGFVMLVLGLKLINIFPRLHNKTLALPKGVSRALGLSIETKEYSHKGSFITGALTFFVPCGFTQAMQLYAVSTGSFIQGALIMGIFALGTLPGIIGIGGLTSAIKGTFARYFFKFAGVVVIALAIFNIKTGSTLAGFAWPAQVVENGQIATSTQMTGIKIEDGKQIVEMTQQSYGYSPKQFIIKKGIPVLWKINSTNQYTCAAYISMPSAGISRPLRAGINTLEFTPKKTGTMRFTCSMGMYSGVFNVID
jgi:uncharacterized protein